MKTLIQSTILLLNLILFFSSAHAGKSLWIDNELRRIREREIISRQRIRRSLEFDKKLNEIEVDLNKKKHINLLEKKILHIPHVKFRVAVFMYEDPWNTGIGNTLATLMAREILFNTAVYSLGVLTYEGDLKPDKSFNLSYFDKVEKLTKDQEVTISLWGRIKPEKNLLVIDTNIQISEYSLDNYFSWNLKLPEAMGGKSLQAHLRPDRIKLQRFKLNKELKPSLIDAADRLQVLHEKPDNKSKIVAKIPLNRVYTVIKKENGWIHMKIEDGKEGWINSKGHHIDACNPLLESAKFVAGLLKYSASRKLMNATDHLTNEALAVKEQIEALDAIDSETEEEIYKNAIEPILRWIGPERWTGIDKWTKIDRGKRTPPGGAAFANGKALAEIAIKLNKRYKHEHFAMIQRMKQELADMKRRNYRGMLNEYDLNHILEKTRNLKAEMFNKIVLNKNFIIDIANKLAKASLNDPNNIDVLINLSVLYSILNDTERIEIVNMLVKKAIKDTQ